ncbi:MAG TPA: hypothetical protein VM680_10560 [Verrucomicrobiae bacterium]|nr:hypothetical protein [Verrucomicrobiae bacterium]
MRLLCVDGLRYNFAAGTLIHHQMKKSQLALLAGVIASIGSAKAAATALPASAALPIGSSTERGFLVRTVEGPATPLLANSSIRATKQLNGTLTDATGALVPNEAVPGSNADGSHNVDLISFEKDGLDFDLVDTSNTTLWNFTGNQLFPGIPGDTAHTENFATEVVGFLELPAGITTFGVSVATDRTDVNDDDSFLVYVAANPRDAFGTQVAQFERNAPPFTGNTHSETVFQVNAPTAGIYPFRILHWQTSHGSNLQFYTIDESTGNRVLVNDTPTDANAIKAYRNSTVANANGPYVAEVSPSPGSAGNSASEAIRALIVDGAATVQTSGVKLFLNNAAVTPQTLTKTGNKISLAYSPNATRPDALNTVRLEYTDSLGTKRTNSWTFNIVTSGSSATTVTGQWDFDIGNLNATVGRPLSYFTPVAQQKTAFSTTTALGISDINGEPAKVMVVPGDLDRSIGYVMDHGISPNGGGTRVNQYTIIFDIYVETTGPGAASLLQISSLNNTDDGDLFWQGNNFGQGTDGYIGRGTFTAGAWHRVVAAYDEAATPPVVTKFVDGIKQDDWTANQGLDAARRALQPTAILFGDGDQDERRVMYVNSIQIRSGKITDAEAAALGGPSAAGIPQTIPASTATGQWNFDFPDLKANIGKDLTYFDPTFDGPAGSTDDKTTFGSTTDFGIADIEGSPAMVMRVPGTLDRRIGYVMNHLIAPNGGGTKVNQYTIIYDIFVEAAGPGAASLLQTSSLNNTDDGDLFWQGNNFGQGTDGYIGRGTFTAGAWHRVVAAYDEAATPPVVTKFVDGIKQHDWTANQGLDAARRALQPTAILFGDGDQDERRVMYVNSIQIRAGKISDAEAAVLGGPEVAGIPVVIPKSTVTGQWDFEFGDLGASIGSDLKYFDPTFDGPTGSSDNKTAFGTTTELGIADIGGAPAKVIQVPGDLTRQLGYIMEHRIAPNGGGTKVNQYTLIFDIMVDNAGPGAASLLQISSLNNTDDGDLFWQGNNFGQGTDGYIGTGAFTPGEWHRVIAAYDEAANPPVVTKFVDGIKQHDWTANQGLDAARRALQPTAILFGDGDQDERRRMWVSAIQIRAGKLSDAEMTELGGPSAEGIPIVLAPIAPPPSLSIARSGPSVTVSWPAGVSGFTLQSTPAIGGAWTAVDGVVGNSVTLPATTGTLFLRLIK